MDLPNLTPLLIDMAIAAREISVPKFRLPYPNGLIAELKKDSSPVSAIDRAVETRLREFIPAAEAILQSSVGFIGEEFPSIYPNAEFQFIVDPIDGTKPYLLGRGEWFTLIGIHQRDVGFVSGLCDQPDADRAWYATLGQGAYMLDRKNLNADAAVQLQQAPVKKIADSILLSFDPYMLPDAHEPLYEKLNARAMYAVPGGDAGNYARLAEGAGQIVLEAVGGIYDLAAITPLIIETGGRMVGINPDLSTFTPDIDFGSRRTVLTTSSAQLRDEVLALL